MEPQTTDEDLLETAVLAGLWTTIGAEKDPVGQAVETQSILVREYDMTMPRTMTHAHSMTQEGNVLVERLYRDNKTRCHAGQEKN